MNREDFLSNVRDFIELQSYRVSNLEEVIRFVFGTNNRESIIFACNQMLMGDVNDDIEEALDSDLPAVMALAVAMLS